MVPGTFIWAVWAASSSQRVQGLPPAPKSMASQRDPLPILLHPLFATVCWKRWGQGDPRGLSQCRQLEGQSEPPATAHAMGSLPHTSSVTPCPISKVAPTSAPGEGSFLPHGTSSALSSLFSACGGEVHW